MLCRKSTYHRAKTDLAATNAELSSTRQQITSLSDDLAKEKAEVSGLNAKLSLQQETENELRKTTARLQEQLEQDRSQHFQELQAAQAEAATLALEGTALKAAKTELEQSLAASQNDCAALHAQITGLQEQLAQERAHASTAALEAEAQLQHARLEQEALTKKVGHLQEALIKVCSVVEEMEQLPNAAMLAFSSSSPTSSCSSVRRSKNFMQLLRESTAALQPAFLGLDTFSAATDQGLQG